MSNRLMKGYYSKKQEKEFGASIYSTPDGKDVLVTKVIGLDDDIHAVSNWDDFEYAGEIVRHIGRYSYGRKGIIQTTPTGSLIIGSLEDDQ